VDLDNFKQVNDTLGHQAGDRLIMEVALTMRRHLRDQDLVARLGGDEFAVVLHDGGTKAAAAVARKLVLAVREEVSTAGLAPAASSPASVPGGGAGGVARSSRAVSGVTVSVGVAPLESVAASPSGLSAAEALKAADEAMYLVKHSGRDGYALAGSGSGKAALRSSELCHAPAGR
jgi:GGDEF domain-containing protein